jgi:hypothetical protein
MVISALSCQRFLSRGSDGVAIVCPGLCAGTESRAHTAETLRASDSSMEFPPRIAGRRGGLAVPGQVLSFHMLMI